MISRILLAMFGAGAITITLLFFMNDMVNRFVLRDPTQYFAITDFIRAPDLGRQLPDVPIVRRKGEMFSVSGYVNRQ